MVSTSRVELEPAVLQTAVQTATPGRHVNIREEYIEALSSCVFPIVYLLAEFEPLTTRNKLLS